MEALGAGLLYSRAGSRARSDQGLNVLGRAGPHAKASAQARHEAPTGPAWARLIPGQAGPKS